MSNEGSTRLSASRVVAASIRNEQDDRVAHGLDTHQVTGDPDHAANWANFKAKLADNHNGQNYNQRRCVSRSYIPLTTYLFFITERCLEGTYIVFLTFLIFTCSQNTEDEVLKAAIAKYGKNQWLVALTPSSIMLSMFSVLVGLVFLLFLSARLQSSAKLVGMNGWIHLSRKRNGPRYLYPPFSFHGLIILHF